MAWDYELANVLKSQAEPSPYKQEFYVATYAGGDFVMLGGQLRYNSEHQIWTHKARTHLVLVCHAGDPPTYELTEAVRIWTNGMRAAALLDEKRNSILILDVIGATGDVLNQ